MDVSGADVSMRYEPEACGPHSARTNAILLQTRHRIRAIDPRVSDVEEHNIGLRPWVQADSGDGLQDFRECLCVGVINFDVGEVVLKGVETACGEDASLTHRATEHMLPPTCFVDQCLRTKEECTGGSAEAFREAEGYGLKGSGNFCEVTATSDGCIDQAGPIKVCCQSVLFCRIRNRADSCFIPDDSTGIVVCVFDADHP